MAPSGNQTATENTNINLRIGKDPVYSPVFSQAARAAWVKLVYRVYEADPLICPHCGNEMRVIAVINDRSMIRLILAHLKLWNPGPPTRSPPDEGSPDWPVSAQLPVEYVPVPDIA